MPVNSTSSAETIEKLRHLFSNFGIPDKVVSDNGTSLSSREFKEFMDNNGIVHTRVAPYHPSSNGQAKEQYKLSNEGYRTRLKEL